MSIEKERENERDAFIAKLAAAIVAQLRADPMADGMRQHFRAHSDMEIEKRLDREIFDALDHVTTAGPANRKCRKSA